MNKELNVDLSELVHLNVNPKIPFYGNNRSAYSGLSLRASSFHVYNRNLKYHVNGNFFKFLFLWVGDSPVDYCYDISADLAN